MGPIIITAKGEAREKDDLQPKDVDREFVMLYHAVDENASPYMRHNIFDKNERNWLWLKYMLS